MDETFTKALGANSQQCPQGKQWVSFRLVDELGEGKSFAGLPYEIFDSSGTKESGLLDSEGYVRLENLQCGPVLLTMNAPYAGGVDTWYERLMIRDHYPLPITALQVAAEQTQRRPADQPSPSVIRAAREKAEFYRVEVHDFVEATRHLPPASAILAPRPSATLAAHVRQREKVPSFGVALTPNKHHVMEVKALRARRPLLSLTPEFSALDAYQLSLFTVLAYANVGQRYQEDQTTPPTYPVPGTIGHVLHTCLANIQTGSLIEDPRRFADAKGFTPLLEEVPYSKRLEMIPFDPERYIKVEEQKRPWDVHSLDHPETNTQAYITHDDRMVLISVRGTQENPPDLWRDIDAAQVAYEEGVGQAHQGFYEAFKAVKTFVWPYLRNVYIGQKIVVCGHSLGGAIALLLAEWIRRDKQLSPEVLLYTYGAPRAADKTFVEGAADLVHHRLVNRNDPIPSVPATWMDTDKRLWIPGLAAIVGGASFGGPIFLAGLVNFEGDPYQHHGTQHYFLPLPLGDKEETSVLWQPNCSGLEDTGCAYYAAQTEADMANRAPFLQQLASMKHHFTISGYVPACHATLLRWQASCSTPESSRLTPREQQWLQKEIESYQRNLEAWEWQARHIHRSHAGRYAPGKRHALERAIRRAGKERQRLPDALGRIHELARQPVTWAQVYGAAMSHPDLETLLARWQSHPENHPSETPQLVRTTRPTQTIHA